jgi:hypothetical protein
LQLCLDRVSGFSGAPSRKINEEHIQHESEVRRINMSSRRYAASAASQPQPV